MSFQRAVIVPLDIYQRCILDKSNESINILVDKSLPSDQKMKLYAQAGLREKEQSKEVSSPVVPRWDHILHNISDKDKPVVKAILDVINSPASQVSWEDNGELIVDGKVIVGSNLINILKYMTGNMIVTSHRDIPLGTKELLEKLTSLNVPPSWIKRKPPREGRRRRAQATDVQSDPKKKKLAASSDEDDQTLTGWKY